MLLKLAYNTKIFLFLLRGLKSDNKMQFIGTTYNLLLAVCVMVIFNKVNVSGSMCSSFFKGSCYFIVGEYDSWYRARRYCENRGGTLASIHSTEENDFLLSLVRLRGKNDSKLWIGLNSFGSNELFQWVDWSIVDFLYFATNETNSFQYEERCCSINGTNGMWNSDHCNAFFYFICKRSISSVSTTVPTTQDPRIGNCKKGWIPHLDRCYYIGGKKEGERLNWTEAKNFCQLKGGYLTSIRNSDEQDFLSYLLQIIGEDAWIGFRYMKQHPAYTWVDNTEVQYLALASHFFVRDNCFKMMYNYRVSGAWIDDKCDRKLGFICQCSKDPKLPPLPSDPDINCVHPEGWLKLNSMCFKMFEGSPLTGNEAELSCNKEGGHLATVSDFSVEALLVYLATEIKQPFYIGLKYDKDSRSFKWINNFPVRLTNWGTNEPAIISKGTCYASTMKGYWKSASCDEKMAYLCQITTDKPKKLDKYVGNCSSSSNLWVPGNNSYCYIFNQKKLNWFDALRDCEKYGSHLLALHSLEESKDIIKLINRGIHTIYLGMKEYAQDGFRWHDDSPVNFVNWDEEEPSHLLGEDEDEHEDQCVEMMTDNMKWKLTPCKKKRHYVCMGLKSTLVVEDSEEPDCSTEHQKLSTIAICLIAFGILISASLVIVAVRYSKEIYRMLQFKRQERNTSVTFENALYDVANSSTVKNNEDER